VLPCCEMGVSTGFSREQRWGLVTTAALSQRKRNRSPGETHIVAQSPVVKMGLLKVCVPSGQGVGTVGEDIICYGIPAVCRIMDFFFFVKEHNFIKETCGSIIH